MLSLALGSVFETESEIWAGFGLLGSLSHEFLALTLESGIDVALPPPKNFNLRILNHFYINQGNAVIFHIFSFIFFSKINKRSPRFILDSKVYNSVPAKMCMLCIALELSCCKKRQKSSNQKTGLGIRGRLVVLNNTKS